MSKETYKFIPVKEEAHQELKELSVKEKKTFDEMVEVLVEFYKSFNDIS